MVAATGQLVMEEGLKVRREGASVRDRGVEADDRSSGRIRGRRSLWAPEGSHIIPLPCPVPASHKEASSCPTVPPSPSHPFKSPQDLKPQILQVRPLCPPLQLRLQLQRKTYWPTCNPLGFKWGVQSAYISARLKGCKEGPSTSWATISAHVRKVHLGLRLVCSLCGRTFFNLDMLRHHRKTHN